MRARAGLSALVVVALVGVVSSPASEATNAPKSTAALAARVDRAAINSLLRPQQVADVLAALGLGAPTRAEADTVAQAISSGSAQARALGADAAFADSEFGNLFGDVAAAGNAEERARLYREVQQLFAEETPYLWLYTSDMATAYDSSFVEGRVRSPFDPCGRWVFQGVRSRH